MFADSNPIVAIRDDRTDVFECHPFSSRYFRTATTTKIRKSEVGDKRKVVIPTTSLLVYCSDDDYPELVIYDLRNDGELARKRIETSPHCIYCSRQSIALLGYEDDLSVYTWDAAGLILQRTVANIYTYPRLSLEGTLFYQQSDEPCRMHFFNCHSIHSDSNSNSTKPAIENKISKSIEMEPGAVVYTVSSNGNLLITKLELGRSQTQFSVYNAETNEIVWKFTISLMIPFCNGQLLSNDSRFLLLQLFKNVLLVDLELKRKLYVPAVKPNYFSCSFRYINGDCYVQIINTDCVEMFKIDEASEEWMPLK